MAPGLKVAARATVEQGIDEGATMKIFLRGFLLATPLTAPSSAWAGNAESSLDDVDHATGKPLDEAGQGRSLSPDEAPSAGAGTPEVVEPGAPVTHDARSLDEVDTGRTRAPDPAPEAE